ncbi:MAG: hypothetical protein NC191_05295 [Muribaculaceae bacterium]|nr:hypothetical protein [Muribaculaceae bacterium]
MNEKQLFESGCFNPAWIDNSTTEESPISAVYTRQNKDLDTLLRELDEIKDRFQEIQAKQWNLAKLIYFNEHKFVEK